MPVISFDEAIVDSEQYGKRNLLLGNGFSIACEADIFTYASLYGSADFTAIPSAKAAFEALGTQDFELVIHALERGARLIPIYDPDRPGVAEAMAADAAALKELLVSTIAENHPDVPARIPEAKFGNCRKFLSYFVGPDNDGRVYTLNYDLLLYWTLMHEDAVPLAAGVELQKNDGFGNDEDFPDEDYVVWQGENSAKDQRIFYLHGALHLFDGGTELKKYTWVRKGQPLIEQARAAINADAYPLFVSEGTSVQKKEKIKHSAYLHHGLKSFNTICFQTSGSMFVYGHSFAANDDHILTRLGRGRFKALYIGLYGDEGSPGNAAIKARAAAYAAMRSARNPLTIVYFDAASARVWE